MEGCFGDHGRLRGGAGRSGWRCRGSLLPGLGAFSGPLHCLGRALTVRIKPFPTRGFRWRLPEASVRNVDFKNVSMDDGLRVETNLFLNDQDPSDVGDVDCLDVVRIVDKMWLD